MQIPLDLVFRPAMAREDFFISFSNQEAVSWLDKWPDWPSPALVIYGEKSCGKTHLLHVWQKQSGADYILACDIDPIPMVNTYNACFS